MKSETEQEIDESSIDEPLEISEQETDESLEISETEERRRLYFLALGDMYNKKDNKYKEVKIIINQIYKKIFYYNLNNINTKTKIELINESINDIIEKLDKFKLEPLVKEIIDN